MKKQHIHKLSMLLFATTFTIWLCRWATVGYYTDEMTSAMEHNRDDIALAALKHGADPNAHYILTNRIYDWRGVIAWCCHDRKIYWHDEPVLNEAAESGDMRLLSALLDAGADINGRNRYGVTALMRGLPSDDARNSTTITQLLLSHGANVNAVDSRGRTALYYATGESEPTRLYTLLKQHGAHL